LLTADRYQAQEADTKTEKNSSIQITPQYRWSLAAARLMSQNKRSESTGLLYQASVNPNDQAD
jgi:hypothetical protein